MKFDISLTTTRSSSQEEADTFIGAMTSRGFSVVQGRINDRYGDKVVTVKSRPKDKISHRRLAVAEEIKSAQKSVCNTV